MECNAIAMQSAVTVTAKWKRQSNSFVAKAILAQST